MILSELFVIDSIADEVRVCCTCRPKDDPNGWCNWEQSYIGTNLHQIVLDTSSHYVDQHMEEDQ